MVSIGKWLLFVLFGIVLVLYRKSKIAKFWMRTVLFGFLFFMISLWVLLLSLFRPGHLTNLSHFRVPVSILGKIAGINVLLRNCENLPPDTVGVLIMNHQNILDVLALLLSPRRNAIVSSKNILRMYPIYAQALWLSGSIFIDLSSTQQALNTMNQAKDILLKEKASLFLCPEGNLNYGDGFLPFKKGAFHLAVQTQVPVYPAVFSCYQRVFDARTYTFETGTIILTCLPPVKTTGMTTEDVPALTERIRNNMIEVYNEISEEALRLDSTK